MPETPKKVGDVVDKAIASINFDWDLQLPRLHGGAAEAAESTSALAKRCSARLRYLSFRIDSESLDTIVKDFDIRARQLYAKWTFKPLQDDGTLPRFPVTKSLLARDVKRGRVLGLNKLTKDQRDKLLELLDTALEDDYQLARDSDSYQRTSTQPSRAASRSISTTRRKSPRHSTSEHSLSSLPHEVSHAITSSNSKPELPPPPLAKMTRKRPSAEPSSDHPRKRKADESAKQTKLNFDRPSLAPTSILPPTPQAQSFKTASSTSSSVVFDNPRQPTTSSVDTSVLDEDEPDSQDLLPTQEATELLEDIALQRSFDAASSTTSSFSATDIPLKLNATFAVAAARLPPGLSFEYMYELQSLALSWRQEPIDIYRGMQKRFKGRTLTPDERNLEYKRLMRFGNLSTPESFGTRTWIPAAVLGKEKHQSIQLNAHLRWASKASDPGLFHLSLKAPSIDTSCRFHRIFGGDRFIALRLPFSTSGDLPSHIRPHAHSIFEHLVKWLVIEHTIAGRQWRAFWIDDKPPKPTKDKPSYNKVYLFATSGIGLSELAPDLAYRAMSIGDFINRHAPFLDNLHSTDLKLFARFKLGLSKTSPTVVLKQHQFRAVGDIIGDDGKSIMNDGCSLMSVALAREISRQLGLEEIPTAIQGRVSGAKGLWIVDFRNVDRIDKNDSWIQISPSQSKIEPHPAKRTAADEYRQFEVSSYSTSSSQPPALNAQFLTVLKDRGVPKTVLEDCLKDHILPYYAGLRNAMADSCLLRSWMQENHPIPRNQETEMLGAFPDRQNEGIASLLDAGFDGQDQHSPLRELLSTKLREYLSYCVEKVKITIKESVFLYCIADPYGILEEGEVHLSLSSRWINPRTGISSAYVDGIDGLVARNPANLPSDIQRIKFVFKQELEHFRDVLVFPSKGKRSLASLLSGGDYDGDQCWACWHPKIVEKFVNYPNGPPDDLTPESCGLTYKAEKLSNVFAKGITQQSVDIFLEKCIAFNLRTPMVGQCTSEHEKVVYQTSLQTEGAIKLGALVAFLVDARKQGLDLSESDYAKIRVKCSGKVKLRPPAYKTPDADAPSKWKSDNIMDYLRFEVASPQRDEILKDFHETYPRELHHASHLAYPWTSALKEAYNDAACKQTLARLKTDVQAVYSMYKLLTGSNKPDADHSQYSQTVNRCFEQYLSIEPLVSPDCQAGFNWIVHQEKDRQHSYWRLLRASCLYTEVTKTRLTWHLAGDELCFLQAVEIGNSVNIITSRMYSTMKIDTKAVKSRFAVLTDGSEHEADTDFAGPIDRFLRA